MLPETDIQSICLSRSVHQWWGCRLVNRAIVQNRTIERFQRLSPALKSWDQFQMLFSNHGSKELQLKSGDTSSGTTRVQSQCSSILSILRPRYATQHLRSFTWPVVIERRDIAVTFQLTKRMSVSITNSVIFRCIFDAVYTILTRFKNLFIILYSVMMVKFG